MAKLIKFSVIVFLLMISAGAFGKSYWATWGISIGLITVYLLPNSRYPLIDKNRKNILIFLSVAFIVALYFE